MSYFSCQEEYDYFMSCQAEADAQAEYEYQMAEAEYEEQLIKAITELIKLGITPKRFEEYYNNIKI